MRRCLLFGLLLALCVWLGYTLPSSVSAQGAATTLTVMVPMRDGVRLATEVYLPAGKGPWPVALGRTTVGRVGAAGGDLWPLAQFTQNGIVRVSQDTRGRHDSEGKAQPFVDDGWGERQDGYDTIAWLREQPWWNGKIATLGIASPGITGLLLAGTGVEGIVGQIVTGGASSVYHHVWFQNGVPRRGLIDGHLRNYAWPPEARQLIQQHPRYDALWATVDLGSRPEQVRWPVVLIGGWYDYFLPGTLDAFSQFQDRGGTGGAGHAHLVIGPWMHPGIAAQLPGFDRLAGELRYPRNAVYPPEAPTQMQWLRFWLTGQPATPANEPAVRYYVMGDVRDPNAPGNVWRTADRWPPPSQPLRLYFTADGGLAPQPPATETLWEYDYNPARPVPTVHEGDEGPADQRRVENRTDVVVFTTPPLTEPLEVTGRITVHLAAATTAPDTDFTAKLTDVYPDGRSMLVTDGIVRASYRNSVERAEFLTPGQRYEFDIDVGSTSLIFNRGHRIRVAISSSNYPRFEANRNNGRSWPADQNSPSVVAHQTIFVGGADGSYLVLPQVGSAGQ
jgi:predicted acyl esterase